jgi:glycosyltransferase involved in cell wall biosynthesis
MSRMIHPSDRRPPHTVLHVLGRASVWGTAHVRLVAGLVRLLDSDRYRLRAWFVDEPGPLVDLLAAHRVPAHAVLFRGRSDPMGVARVAQALRRDRPGIVHFHVGGRSRTWLLRILSPAKRVAHLHGAHGDDGEPISLEPFVRSCHAVVATSRAVAAAAGCGTVVYPGAEVPGSKASLRERPPTIGAVGRLEPVKGLGFLLEAAALLRPRFPDLRVELAGSGSDESRLRSLAERLGLAGSVGFLGWQNDVNALHRRWQVLVQPSLHEAFGLAALEAMASGVPVVASATGGLPELVEDEQSGFLVSVGDVEALASRLGRLLEDEALRLRMGEAARRRAESSFSVAEMAARTAAVYDRLIGR